MREAGFQIDKIQSGDAPAHYRPMPSIGSGVIEIRIREDNGQFRVFYVANRGSVVYVLHCFQKKSRKTSRQDIDTGKQRFSALPPGNQQR